MDGLATLKDAGPAQPLNDTESWAWNGNRTAVPSVKYLHPNGAVELPTVKVNGTNCTLQWNYSTSVDVSAFNRIVNTVLHDVGSNREPTASTPYVTSSSDLSFSYTIAPGYADAGLRAFPGTVAWWEWFRSDGGSNLGAGTVTDSLGHVVAAVDLSWAENGNRTAASPRT